MTGTKTWVGGSTTKTTGEPMCNECGENPASVVFVPDEKNPYFQCEGCHREFLRDNPGMIPGWLSWVITIEEYNVSMGMANTGR